MACWRMCWRRRGNHIEGRRFSIKYPFFFHLLTDQLIEAPDVSLDCLFSFVQERTELGLLDYRGKQI